MKLDLSRQDICNLMLACSNACSDLEYYGEYSHKWTELHDRIAEQLKALDEKAERSARKGYKED